MVDMTVANASSLVRQARQFFRRLCRRSRRPATPSVVPSRATDAGAVAVDGRDAIPSTLAASRAAASLEPLAVVPFCVPFPAPLPTALDEVAPLGVVHALLKSVVGDGPADASAPRHVDPEGVPPAALPSEPFAEKSSDAEDGAFPQFVPRLASVGTPGDASAVEHVDA